MYRFSVLPVGRVLENRYKLIEDCTSNKTGHKHLLGSGGFGAVYLAHDLSLNCEVAVKQAILQDDKDSLTMFRREAQFLANLTHPTLPKVSRFFADEKNCFIVMDLIRGDDLEERVINSGKLPFAEVREIALQLFEVLEYLHSHSIIHKDIKPANLKYTSNGQLKLLDFGLAKGSVGLMSEHKETVVKGLTRAWASPEQLNSKPTTAQSDLYSASATLYYLATGLVPPSAHKRVINIATLQIDLLSRLDNMQHLQLPEWFAEIINEGMSLAIEKRPRSAAVMRGRLAKLTWVEPQRILEEDAEDVKYFKRGNNHYNTRDFDKAIESYNTAIELNPNFADGYQKRADAYFHKNNFYMGIFTHENVQQVRNNLNQSIKDATRAIKLKPDFAEAYVTRAHAYFSKRQFKRCAIDCDKAVELNPNFAEAYCTRGKLLWYLGIIHNGKIFNATSKSCLDKALTDCDRAIELRPDLAEAYCYRGNVYSAKGDYNQSINDYTRSIKLDNLNNSHLYFSNRGLAYFEKGNLQQAISDYSKAIELKPDFLYAYANRAFVYKKTKEKTKEKADRQKGAEFTTVRRKLIILWIITMIDLVLSVGLIFLFLFNIGSWLKGIGFASASLYSYLFYSGRFQGLKLTTLILIEIIFAIGFVLMYFLLSMFMTILLIIIGVVMVSGIIYLLFYRR